MRTDSAHLNRFRNRTHPTYKSEDSLGMMGFFVVPLNGHTFAIIISAPAQEGYPWDHVSVRIGDQHKNKLRERIPTWAEMCVVKEMFFTPEECVMQLHPAEKDYVNFHPCVLHLWRPTEAVIPMPPRVCV